MEHVFNIHIVTFGWFGVVCVGKHASPMSPMACFAIQRYFGSHLPRIVSGAIGGLGIPDGCPALMRSAVIRCFVWPRLFHTMHKRCMLQGLQAARLDENQCRQEPGLPHGKWLFGGQSLVPKFV